MLDDDFSQVTGPQRRRVLVLLRDVAWSGAKNGDVGLTSQDLAKFQPESCILI